MGENFLAEQARRFKHRMDEGRRELLKPDLLSHDHPIFDKAYTCQVIGNGDVPDDPGLIRGRTKAA